MGVHVILEIDPHCIDKSAWAAVYDDTLALLEAWQPRLLGWGQRSIEGIDVPMYTRSIRQDEDDPNEIRWSIVGDRDSLQTAECQSLHRSLGHYADRRSQGTQAREEILITAARPNRDDTVGPVRVFGNKTQGCPYHFAMLAAAMLVEERFPRHAMVWGDIDRGQAEETRRMAAPLLGRELTLPVRVDAPRLIERLRAHYDEDALPGVFARMFLGEMDERHEAMLHAFPGESGARQWQRALADCKSPTSLGAIRLVIAWLNAGRDLRDACRLACIAPRGPRFSPDAFIDAIASTWVAIPLDARESLDVLRKPSGASHTVASLLGSFFLDMAALGRHLRIHLTPDSLAADLSAAFGDQGLALAVRLSEKSVKIEAQLRERSGDVSAFVARASEQSSDDMEALVILRSPVQMRPNQRTWVRLMAWSVMTALASLRDGSPKIAAALGCAEEAKRLLVRVLADRGPVLTEDAWDELLAESDVEVLAWWVALVSMQADELHLSQIRRAFFENGELRRYATSIGHNEREMREIGELFANARTGKKR